MYSLMGASSELTAIAQTVLLAVLPVLRVVEGYSEGAPEQVCDTLIPGHLQPPQTTPCPYTVELSTYTCPSNHIKYNPIGGNQMINITVGGVQGFKGFILQARMNNKVVGRFEPSPLYYRMLDCSGGEENTATHVHNDIKSEVILKWVPPTKVEGQVWFYASVVQNFDTYWTNVTSECLTLTRPAAAARKQR